MTLNEPYEMKLVIVGNTNVGKTCIVKRETTDQFEEDSVPTLGASYVSKLISQDDKFVRIQIWDTAGQEKFRTMTPMFYRGADAAIICYSITDKESFEAVREWKCSLDENAPLNLDLFIIGNKSDIEEERSVTFQEGKEKAMQHKAEFFEVSAKNGSNVKELFESVCSAYLRRKSCIKTEEKLNLETKNENTKKGCC